MKKIIALILAMIMVMGLFAGCNKNPDVTNPTDDTVDTVPTDDVVEPTDEVINPVVDVPVVEVDEKIVEVFTAVQTVLGEDYIATMDIMPEMYEGLFAIPTDAYESIYGQMPMISTHVDILLGVKATDVTAVETAMQAYIDGKIADTMQYPMNVAKFPAMKIHTVGDYVFLVGTFGMCPDEGDDEIFAIAETNVNKAIEAIDEVFQ